MSAGGAGRVNEVGLELGVVTEPPGPEIKVCKAGCRKASTQHKTQKTTDANKWDDAHESTQGGRKPAKPEDMGAGKQAPFGVDIDARKLAKVSETAQLPCGFCACRLGCQWGRGCCILHCCGRI